MKELLSIPTGAPEFSSNATAFPEPCAARHYVSLSFWGEAYGIFGARIPDSRYSCNMVDELPLTVKQQKQANRLRLLSLAKRPLTEEQLSVRPEST